MNPNTTHSARGKPSCTIQAPGIHWLNKTPEIKMKVPHTEKNSMMPTSAQTIALIEMSPELGPCSIWLRRPMVMLSTFFLPKIGLRSSKIISMRNGRNVRSSITDPAMTSNRNSAKWYAAPRGMMAKSNQARAMPRRKTWNILYLGSYWQRLNIFREVILRQAEL